MPNLTQLLNLGRSTGSTTWDPRAASDATSGPRSDFHAIAERMRERPVAGRDGSRAEQLRDRGSDRPDRVDRADRGDRGETIDRRDDSVRTDRPERSDRADRPDRADRSDRAERSERPRVDRDERPGPTERVAANEADRAATDDAVQDTSLTEDPSSTTDVSATTPTTDDADPSAAPDGGLVELSLLASAASTAGEAALVAPVMTATAAQSGSNDALNVAAAGVVSAEVTVPAAAVPDGLVSVNAVPGVVEDPAASAAAVTTTDAAPGPIMEGTADPGAATSTHRAASIAGQPEAAGVHPVPGPASAGGDPLTLGDAPPSETTSAKFVNGAREADVHSAGPTATAPERADAPVRSTTLSPSQLDLAAAGGLGGSNVTGAAAPVATGSVSVAGAAAAGVGSLDAAAPTPGSSPNVAPVAGASSTPTARIEYAQVATAAASAPTPEFVEENAGRILGVARLLQRGEGAPSSMTLHLQPAHLGRVRVELSSIDGDLTVHMSAEHRSGIDVIAAALPTLRASLEGDGVRVADVSVSSNASGNDGQDLTQRQATADLTDDRRDRPVDLVGGREAGRGIDQQPSSDTPRTAPASIDLADGAIDVDL